MDSTAQLLRRKQVEARTGLRRSKLYDLVKRGLFPAPIHLSARCVAWVASEIDVWIARRISESRSTPTPAEQAQ